MKPLRSVSLKVLDWGGEAERGNVGYNEDKEVRKSAATESNNVGVERRGIVSAMIDLSKHRVTWMLAINSEGDFKDSCHAEAALSDEFPVKTWASRSRPNHPTK